MYIRKTTLHLALLGGVFFSAVALAGCVPQVKSTNEQEVPQPQHTIQGTSGNGIYPRVEPTWGAETMGPLINEGEAVKIVCETRGETLSNGGYYTDVWEGLEGGGYIPNGYVATGANGRNESAFPEC